MRQLLTRRAMLPIAAVVLLTATASLQQRANVPEYTQGGPLPDIRMLNTDFNAVTETIRHVAGNVYVVAGAGSQIGVLAGDDGVLIVDDQFAPLSQKVAAEIRKVSDKPVRFVVDTHMHPDHMGGNENFAKMGATIFAHDNVRIRLLGGTPPGAMEAPGTAEANASFARRMAAIAGGRGAAAPPARGADGRAAAGARGDAPPPGFGGPTPKAALPLVTTSHPLTFHIDGEDVTIVPAPRPSHTDGDVFVYFRGSNVLSMGDVYTTDYPAMGPGNGGTVDGFLENWKFALDNYINDQTKIIPGHGQVGTKKNLVELRDATIAIRDRIREMVRQGMTVEQVKAARPSKPWDAKFAMENVGKNDVFTTDLWYDIMYADAKAFVAKSRR